uniref:Hemagglutinin n=1 Tax=Dracunculus medinensis TaxID=318479 RepID=A0A0N4UK41_DRAME
LRNEFIIEIKSRVREAMCTCHEIIILQNNGYITLSTDWEFPHIRSFIEELNNDECTTLADGWTRLGKELTDIERVFNAEQRLSHEIEWRPSLITVGAIGGIAVVALAMSIFWGLNGSAFTTK